MAFHILESRVMTLVGAGCLLLPLLGLPQAPSANPSAAPPVQSEIAHSRLLVYVRELNGETIKSQALVTVTRMANQYWQQMTAQGGQASFDDISPGRYTVQAIAVGYEEAVEELEIVGGGGQSVIVSLRPESPGGEATPVAPDPPLLAAKAQKELAKALEALRVGKLAEARKHLDAAYRLAPSHPDVNFGFGVYSSQVNDWQQARSLGEGHHLLPAAFARSIP
jgi:hypothetical protein